MNKNIRFFIVSSLVLLTILFSFYDAFGKIPKLFLKFVEKQNKVKSGYVKVENIYITDNDTTNIDVQEAFFISTHKDLKYLVYYQSPMMSHIFCKSAHTIVMVFSQKDSEYKKYRYYDEVCDAKHDTEFHVLSYSTIDNFSLDRWENCIFQRIAPKVNKKNIRYKILYPDDDVNANRNSEWEFERKTFNLIQDEYSLTYFGMEHIHGKIDILEQRLFEYIHPDILDTISFKFDELKKGYDQQFAEEQAKIDSAFRDSIVSSVSKNAGIWAEGISRDVQKDTLFFMPKWKFSLLSGDTIYSDSINSRFLLIDMGYLACHPCRLAMHDLASIDTLYDESLLKMFSINITDKDTVKINQVLKNLNLKYDVALSYDNRYDIEMSKQMGDCDGYPQLYLIDMNTRQVIWHSCGWYKGFTIDIEEIIKEKENEK